MLNPETIREILKDRNLKEVARKSGINHHALYRWYNGDVTDPKYYMIKKLSDYIESTILIKE